MNLKLLILSCLIFVSCNMNLTNKYDTTNSSYWINSYVIPRALRPPPSAISSSNGTTQVAFYIGYPIDGISISTTGFATSYTANSTLPAGVSLNSTTGGFTGTPTALSTSTAYNFTTCSIYGCASGSLSIRVINATATRVYGQGGDFTTSAINNGGVSANSLSQPNSIIGDSSGGIYISDYGNGRVLFFPSGSTTATRVYGQSGSFTTSSSAVPISQPTATANNLFKPSGLALDNAGGLYISDSGFNRILHFPAGSIVPDNVYGTGGSYTLTTTSSTRSASNFNGQTGISLDNANGLYVADKGNNRVLYFPSGSTTATRVYGQAGNFTFANSNNNGISADSLNNPSGVSLDSNNGLYVSDEGNNRVLYFASGSTTAIRFYGTSSFSTANSDLNSPRTSIVDSTGGLFTVDYVKNRVVYFPENTANHIVVYGQGGSLSKTNAYFVSNVNQPNANSLSLPESVFVTSSGTVFICDSSFNRVLMY